MARLSANMLRHVHRIFPLLPLLSCRQKLPNAIGVGSAINIYNSKKPIRTTCTSTKEVQEKISNRDINGNEKVVNTIVGIPLSQAKYNASLLNALSVEHGSAEERRRVRKQEVIAKFRRSDSDTGSPEVQSMFLATCYF